MTVSLPNTWTRLEPRPRDETLLEGLQARVGDPLWLLTRQLAVGEFSGTDGGSPVTNEVTATVSALTRLRGGPPGARGPGQVLPAGGAPLEVLVQAEPELGPRHRSAPSALDDHGPGGHPAPRPGVDPGTTEGAPSRPLASAQAGLHFLRLLAGTEGVGDLTTYRRGLLATYPLPVAAGDVDGPGRPPQASGQEPLLRLFAGRAPDAQLLYTDLLRVRADPPTLPAQPDRTGAADAAVVDAALRWLDWYESTTGTPHSLALAQEPTWSPERMGYQVSVAAPGPGVETVLAAGDDPGDGLDWWDFDVVTSRHQPGADTTATSLGSTPDDPDGQPRRLSVTTLVTPVHYPGAPDPRWWAFEDAAVDFGDISAAAESTTTSVVVEFALQYSNDHLIAPLTLPVGALCAVDSLVVTDTFGRRLLVRSSADVEPDGPFRLFEQAPTSTERPRDPLFVLFPTLAEVVTGPPLETVHYVRDELADTVWAIESLAPGPTGAPVDRSSRSGGPPVLPTPTLPGEPQVLTYRLRTAVEENWFAFTLPDPAGPTDSPNVMPFAEIPSLTVGGATPRPWGAVLSSQTGGLPQEEVTRSGIAVSRAWRSARWVDGQDLAWVCRRRGPVRSSESSGLRWDTAG